MLKSHRSTLLLLAAGLAVQCTPPTASAATYYWDPTVTGGAAVGGAGVWGGPLLSWSTAASGGTNVAWLDGSSAVLGGTVTTAAPATITLGSAITVGNINISVPGYTISTVAGALLTLTGGITATAAPTTTAGTTRIDGPGGLLLSDNQTISVTNGMNISTVLSGSDTLTKAGGGALGLGGANTFTGKFVVSAGMIVINSDASLGAAPVTAQADSITLNGGLLTVGVNVTGATNFSSGGTVTLNANRGIVLGASGGTFRMGFATDTLVVNGVISGSGKLTKTDSGILVINSTSAYTGGTLINNGTLQIGSGGTVGTLAAGQVEFSGTGTASTLAFNRSDNGTIANNILVSSLTGRANVTTPNGVGVTLAGVISGPGEFWANGNIVLTGNNTYGATNIRGNLQVGNGGTTGNLGTGKITFGANGFLTFNRTDDVTLANDIDSGSRLNIGTTTGRTVTLTGARTGNGELWVHGTGTVVVVANANSNWVKNTVLEGGALQVSDLTRSATSPIGTGNIYFGQASTTETGAGLIYTGASVATDAFINIQSPYAFLEVTNPNTTLSFINGFAANRPNAGSGANLLTKRGAGAISFEGSLDSTRMRIQMEGGTLLLGKMDNVDAHAVAGADALILNAGLVKITGNNGDQIYNESTIQVNGGVLDFNGHNEAFNGFSGSTSAGVITNTAAGTQSKLSLGMNNSSSVFAGKVQDGAGTMALAKSGTGALTLTGTNVVSGGTELTNGRLIVNGSLTGGLTQVSGDATTGTYVGGTLGGTGTVGAVTTYGGIVAPGATATGSGLGTLKMGTLDLSANGTLDIAISTSALAASLAQIEGDLVLGFSAAVLKLSDIGPAVGIEENPVFTIVSYTGTWDGLPFLFGSVGELADDSTFAFGPNVYRIDYNAAGAVAGTKEVTLTVVVPEPATGGTLAAGLALLGLHWRRRSGRRSSTSNRLFLS